MSLPRASVAIAVVVALLGLGVGLDAVLPAGAPAEPEPAVAGEATSGAWYCAAADDAGGSTVDVIAAVPPRDTTTPALLESEVARDGVATIVSRAQVVPSAAASFRLGEETDADGPSAITTRWWELPVAVSRVWDVQRADDVSGQVVGPCERMPSDRWVVPGVATAGGAQAELHLANPFDSDASVTVSLATRDGLLGPKLLENVVVPKRSSRVVDLNEFAPEQTDLGVVVQTRSGRVIAEAVQSFNAAVGGVEGLSLVKALPQLAENWTIPWFADGGDAASWLWVTNPDPDRSAAVELSIHTADGGTVPEGIGEITVDPGSVLRVDLRGLLPEGASTGALTVRSDNGVPIAASVASQRGGTPAPDGEGDGEGESDGEEAPPTTPEERSGIAILSGSESGDPSWVLTGGPTAGRDVSVHLVNASAEEATVDLAIWAGAGLVRPPELQGITIAPGAVRVVDVTSSLVEASDHTIFVQAQQGQVVAGRVATSREGRLDLVASTGQAMGIYAGGRTLPPVQFAPGMPQRLGTRLGPDAVTRPSAVTPAGDEG